MLRLGACEVKQQWQMAMKLLCDLDDRHELQASILFLDIKTQPLVTVRYS